MNDLTDHLNALADEQDAKADWMKVFADTDEEARLFDDGADALRAAAARIEQQDAALADAWKEGRESIARDMMRPVNENGMKFVTPNPYLASTTDPEES